MWSKRSAHAALRFLRVPWMLLALMGRGMRVLLIAILCGALPPPHIPDPPAKNPVTAVKKVNG